MYHHWKQLDKNGSYPNSIRLIITNSWRRCKKHRTLTVRCFLITLISSDNPADSVEIELMTIDFEARLIFNKAFHSSCIQMGNVVDRVHISCI